MTKAKFWDYTSLPAGCHTYVTGNMANFHPLVYTCFNKLTDYYHWTFYDYSTLPVGFPQSHYLCLDDSSMTAVGSSDSYLFPGYTTLDPDFVFAQGDCGQLNSKYNVYCDDDATPACDTSDNTCKAIADITDAAYDYKLDLYSFDKFPHTCRSKDARFKRELLLLDEGEWTYNEKEYSTAYDSNYLSKARKYTLVNFLKELNYDCNFDVAFTGKVDTIAAFYEPSQAMTGFPEAIDCINNDADATKHAFLWLKTVNSWDNNVVYSTLEQPNEQLVTFKYSDRSYLSRIIDPTFGNVLNLRTIGCVDKSLHDLFTEGKAFNMVTSRSKLESPNDAMVEGRPDLIICRDNAKSSKHYFWAHKVRVVGTGSNSIYKNQDTYLTFDTDSGVFVSRTGVESESCDTKSIDQLYAAGDAFNLVGNGRDNTDSLDEGWPDVIECGGPMYDRGNMYYLLRVMEYAIYAQRDYATNTTVKFNLDKSFEGSTNSSVLNEGCNNKSIGELVLQKRAFNFVRTRDEFDP